MSTAARYRPEIDGLRAIAVMSVIWFHAGLTGMSGGFLGVDIFFAISGFLITGIIVRAAEAGNFTLGGFYMRRVRRIIPALLLACALTLPFAVWLMLPDDLENYGQSLVASVASANNVLLYFTSGYFALESHYKPLIHTWSLGAEEQYYFIVPLLLAFAVRLHGRSGAILALGVLSLASLALSEWLRMADPDANFYLLPSRFWQLGLGGLAALSEPRILVWLPDRRIRQILAAAGLAAVLASLFVLGEGDNLPGWQSLLPICGTVLLLIFADSTGAGRLLASPPMRWVGLISYSAYLYHQPVFAFVRIASLNEPSAAIMAATVPLILALAWASWRFVERPFRDPAALSTKQVLAVSLGGSLLLGCIGLALYATSGLRARWPELADNDALFGARQNASYVQRPFAYEGKPFSGRSRADNMLVVGNSFARDFINMGLETGQFERLSLSYASHENCAEPWPRSLVQRARQAGSVVLGSGVVRSDAACTRGLIRRLEALGVEHVVAIGTKNFGFNNNAVMLLPAERRYAYRARPLAEVLADNAAGAAAIPARHYVNLLALLDDGRGTVPVFTPEHKFISQDRRHLTAPGAAFLGRLVFAQPQFAFLRQRRSQ